MCRKVDERWTLAGRMLATAVFGCLALLGPSLVGAHAATAEIDETPKGGGGGVTEHRFRAFLVSGVLRATSGDEALGLFTRRVLKDYSGYTLATTLVSEIASGKIQGNGRPLEEKGKAPPLRGGEI